MSDQPLHSVSVAAVILDDHDRVLLIQRADTGEWQIPGGVLEHDEDARTGLRREVLEETGLRVVPDRLTGIYQHLPRRIVALVFLAHSFGGNAAPGVEAREIRWVSRDEAVELLTAVFAVRVSDALTDGDAPAVRAHDGHQLIDLDG